MTLRTRDVSINISGISVSGVGGLGLVAAAALTAYVLPEARWFTLFGVGGGALLGVTLIFVGRHHTSPGPSGDDPRILFRAAAEADRSASPRPSSDLPLNTAVARPA